MTKKEYMKKLAYQLRRLPKEDFDKAMDYFEEYFEDAGIENEQKAIEDLGAPEEAASALILDLAQENAVKPPKTMKRRFSALWIAILALFAAPIALPLALGILAVIASLILGILAVVGGILVTALAAVAGSVLGIIGGIAMLIGCGILVTYFIILLARWLIVKLAGLLGKLVRKEGKRHEEK